MSDQWVRGGGRHTYLEDVWEMYRKSYASIGMHIAGASDLLDYDTWEVFRNREDKPVAFNLYKTTSFGLKTGLLGSDGSAEGKSTVKQHIKDRYKQSGIYGEVSHAVERLAEGAPVVCAIWVPEIIKKEVEPLADGIHYNRSLQGVGVVTKKMVGRPRGIPVDTVCTPTNDIAYGSETKTASNSKTSAEAFEAAEHLSCQLELDHDVVTSTVKRFRARTASGEGMGAWDGEEHYWPVMQEFAFSGDTYDRFGDAYKAMYQYVGGNGHHVELFVKFDATDFTASGGKAPMEWLAKGAGSQTQKGTLRKIEDIKDVLQKSLKWAESVHKKVEQEVLKIGGPKWEVHYDGYDLNALFKSDDDESDASMDVTFSDAEEAIFQGQICTAEVAFSSGSDYEGHFGEQRINLKYNSVDSMKEVLKEAERLWKLWTKEEAARTASRLGAEKLVRLTPKELERASEGYVIISRPQPDGQYRVMACKIEGTNGTPLKSGGYNMLVDSKEEVSAAAKEIARWMDKMGYPGLDWHASRSRR